ncbi:hypothetical protein BH09MYX1_BH09MYX1_49620 [soil metagenome]
MGFATTSPIRFARQALAIAAVAALTTTSGCKDQGKESAKKAAADVDALAEQVDKDVSEIETGLPEGAKALGALYGRAAPDPKSDPAAVKQALLKTIRDVPSLTVAKSTFFALADEKGMGIRNNLDQDAMAGQDLMTVFPDLAKVPASPTLITTTGTFPGSATANGPDKTWIAALPVKGEDGTTKGIFVTGWAYRRFALHLQEVLKRTLQDALVKGGDSTKLPVFYVGVFDKAGVYTERTTPKGNEDALTGLSLADKTATGAAQGTITLTERDFGWAAKRTPKLGPDTGIVVLRSEL